MTKYGDEKFIYKIAQEQSQDQGEDVHNDIKNGYAMIREERKEFSERCVVEDWLYMTIPSDFVLMPEEDAIIKYPNRNRPHIIFTNEYGSTNITFTFSKDKLTDDKIEEAKSYLEQTIIKMTAVEKMISSYIIEENIKIGCFNYISPAFGADIYNLMFIFPLEGKFVVGNFNCLHLDKAAWSEIAEQMIRSIRVPEQQGRLDNGRK
jgi:hypothetical protein